VHGSVDLWISCFIGPVGEIDRLVNRPSWSMDQLVNGPVGQQGELGKLQAELAQNSSTGNLAGTLRKVLLQGVHLTRALRSGRFSVLKFLKNLIFL